VGRLAASLGIPPLAGPFLLAAVAYAAAALLLTGAAATGPAADRPGPRRGRSSARRRTCRRGVLDRTALRLGGLTMVATQLAMVAVMTGTPIHMRDHGHGLGATGAVIGLHIAAMFLPSPLTGRLADRFGSRPVIAAGGATLLAAGVVGAVVPGESTAGIAVALVLLGLGWNLGLLGGTTLLTAAVPLAGRARVQGRVDVAVALAGATGALSSGLVVAGAGYGALSLVSGVLAFLALGAALRPVARPA
jgi:MFS family permease